MPADGPTIFEQRQEYAELLNELAPEAQQQSCSVPDPQEGVPVRLRQSNGRTIQILVARNTKTDHLLARVRGKYQIKGQFRLTRMYPSRVLDPLQDLDWLEEHDLLVIEQEG